MGFIVRALCLLSLGLIYFFQCFGRATILNVFIFICGLQLGVNESSAAVDTLQLTVHHTLQLGV
jgi:hypothetical protein